MSEPSLFSEAALQWRILAFTQGWIAGTLSLVAKIEQKTAIDQLVFSLSTLMSFPFIFVPHNILNKEEKSHVRVKG